jgi:SAM-dependent methyltransferase
MRSAIEEWKSRAAAHHAQTLKSLGPEGEGDDFYSALASRFKEDPRRTDDPVLGRLLEWVSAETSVLDVGGGAGRYALPLALRCKDVTVVEPSESMVRALREGAEEAAVRNVRAVPSTLEEANVEPAELVICAHVVYGIEDIEPFVRKLESHGRERVAVLAYMDAPLSMVSPVWEAVYGEKRVNLPALPELVNVLWEMEIYPNAEMFAPAGQRAAPNRDTALAMLRGMLRVDEGTERDERLVVAMDELVEETEEGLVISGWRRRPQGLVWWAPGAH